MTGRLAGKTALVTGGARGIGLGIARRLAAAGATVFSADHVPPAPDIPPRFLQVDVRDPQAVEAMIGTVIAAGPLDIVVHAAGSTGGGYKFLDIPMEEWRRHIETNLTGTFLVAQAAARAMRDAGIRGSIVTVGSVNSFAALRGSSAYAASKGGVWVLTRGMAVDLAPFGIRANMIAPGPIRVERNAALFDSPEMAEKFRQSVPLGIAGTPDDVAGLAEFLASDDAKFITGSAFTVDGGLQAVLPV